MRLRRYSRSASDRAEIARIYAAYCTVRASRSGDDVAQLAMTGAGGGAVTSTPPAPVVYLLDTFVDADMTPLDMHTMDVGPGWTDPDEDWLIESDSAVLAVTSLTPEIAYSDAGVSDYTLTSRQQLASTAGAGVCFRRTTDTTYLWATISDISGLLIVGQTVAGVPSVIGQQALALTPLGFFVLRVVLAGAQLTVSVDGLSPAIGPLTIPAGAGLTQCGLYSIPDSQLPAWFRFLAQSE